MAKILLSTNKVLGKLGSLAYQEVLLAWGVKSDAKSLEHTLVHTKTVFSNAEEQKAKNCELEVWYRSLKMSVRM